MAQGTGLDGGAVDEMQRSFLGELVRPGDVTYNEHRKVWNGSIDRHPALIARCTGVADIRAALRLARSQDLRVAVRGGGHSFPGLSVCDGGMVIDLGPMKRIQVNPEARTARVQAGVLLGELDRETQEFGLAVPSGIVTHTGVAGLTLGGGIGWVMRKYGLTIDQLLSVDLVTADGETVRASEDQNPDLFWGVRGGGGNFGIVTSFEFKVHPLGEVLAGLTLHPIERGREALRFWRGFELKAPQEVTDAALIFKPPADLPVPDVLRAGAVGLGGVFSGPLETAERVLRPLREFGPPTADTYQAMPYSAAQTMADFLWPRGRFNYWKSGYLKALSDEVIDVLLAAFVKAPSEHTVIVLEHNGHGAMERVPEDATAFGDRGWPFNLLVTSAWTGAAESEANVRWTRELWSAVQPFLSPSVYVNYLGEQSPELVRAAYGKKYERLVALKDKYDPTNFFCMNQNIRPSSGPAAVARSA